MGSSNDILGKAARWVGFVAGLLTLILGLIHIIKIEAHIHWPDGKVTSDFQQRMEWRLRLFTFIPEIFLDVWTPFVMGLIGSACHFKQFTNCQMVTANYIRYGVFLFVMALFGNLGYNGGAGILIGSVTLLACLLALVAYFVVDDSSACLGLSLGIKIRSRDGVVQV